MKRRIRKAAALVLSLVMAFSLTCVPAAATSGGVYSDISKNDACYDAAIYLKNAGYMVGTGNSRFSPDDPVSRGMAVTVLYRMAGEPKVDGAVSFPDLKRDRYDSDALVWAVQKGILTGYPDNTIQADRSVSGSEVNSILSGYAKSICGFEWKGPADETAATLSRGQFAIAVYELCKQSDGKITRISGLTELLVGYDMMAKEERGEKTTLTAYTSDGTAKNVAWISSDEGVATVSAEGVVWAKGVGKTEITASNSQGSMSVTVTVTENMTIEPDEKMAVTFYTYAYKSAQAMLGHNDEVEDEDMQAVMEEVQAALDGMGAAMDDSIVIGPAADDFDAAFEQLLKPYIGMIETHLGVKGVK